MTQLSPQLLSLYTALAVREVEFSWLGWWGADRPFFAHVEALPGCYGDGETPEEAVDELKACIPGWVVLKYRDGDNDIPQIGGVDINRAVSECWQVSEPELVYSVVAGAA